MNAPAYLAFLLFLFLFLLYPGTTAFDYYKLSLTWPKTFCLQPGGCTSCPDRFTIHGLWPSVNKGPQPENCDDHDVFVEANVLDLLEEMRWAWPNLNGGESGLWGHEWSKHGTCSSMNQHSYFKSATSVYENYNIKDALKSAKITPSFSRTYKRWDIVNAIAASTGSQPQLDCSPGGHELLEVRLCLDSDLDLIDCPTTPPWTNCKKWIQFPSNEAAIVEASQDPTLMEEKYVGFGSRPAPAQRSNPQNDYISVVSQGIGKLSLVAASAANVVQAGTKEITAKVKDGGYDHKVNETVTAT